LPNTTQKLLTPKDLQGLSAHQLTILRNGIFARYGRRFKEPDLQSHFDSQSWYRPRYEVDQFPVSVLSEIDMENAVMIRDYQTENELI
jgi:YARHG domain